MQRILSTYRFINHPLGSAILAEIAAAGFSGMEVFCAPQHFSYRDSQAIRELGDALGEHRLRLHSLHAPTERDLARDARAVCRFPFPTRRGFAGWMPWMKSNEHWTSRSEFRFSF